MESETKRVIESMAASVVQSMAASIEMVIENEVRRRVITALNVIRPGDLIHAQPTAIVHAPSAPAGLVRQDRRRGPSRYRGVPIEPKPCPVTGILNKHRRWSYLMPEARTPENLRKFRRT